MNCCAACFCTFIFLTIGYSGLVILVLRCLRTGSFVSLLFR